jgi:CheY-like chemotaxis protein
MSQMKPFEIIIAEDNLADIELVRLALAEHKVECRLHVFRDGVEAMTFISDLDGRQGAPEIDLVLVDMHLPKRDGEEILGCLRATERYALTPVIVMTSSPSSILEQKEIRHAALGFFQKPSTLAEFMELGAIVRRVLERHTTFRSEKQEGLTCSGGIA